MEKGLKCQECIKLEPDSWKTVSSRVAQKQAAEGVIARDGSEQVKNTFCKTCIKMFTNVRNRWREWELERSGSEFGFQYGVSERRTLESRLQAESKTG